MGKVSETRYSNFFFQKPGYFFKFFKKQSKQRPKMTNMEIIIIKSFMQGHFHSLKSLFDVLQVVGVICNYLNNSSS